VSLINFLLAGCHYEIACDDGQETHVKAVAQNLDERMRRLSETLGRTSEAQLLMVTAMTLTDAVMEQNAALETLRAKVARLESGDDAQSRQRKMEEAIASTIHHVATRIESIAATLEKV
jgi:cell division protein ZapA